MRPLAAASLVCCMAMPAVALDREIEVLASTGEPIDGRIIAELRSAYPAINSAGEVVFTATLVGETEGYPDVAVVVVRGGVAELVARTGEHAPGTPKGVTLGGIGAVGIDEAGRVAFVGGLIGVFPPSQYGLWEADPGGPVTLVARMGDPAPGTGDPLPNFATSTGPGGDFALWESDVAIWSAPPGGPLAVVAQIGGAGPGALPGDSFSWFWRPLVDASGAVAFAAGLHPTVPVWGIFAPDESGHPTMVVRTGDPAPGVPGASFRRLRLGALNDAGEIAFRGTLAFEGEPDDVDELFLPDGIWGPGLSGTTSLIARAGDPAPGTPGVAFERFDEELVLDDAGRVTVSARLEGEPAGARGLWRSDAAGGLALVARVGDPLPDLSGRSYHRVLDFRTSRSGRLLFGAETIPNALTDQLQALVEVGPDGFAEVVLSAEDVVAVAPGTTRTVASIWSQREPEVWSRPGGRTLNDAGQFPVAVTFTDGSQAIVLVPEPARALLVAVGALVLAATRRR